jgi:uncharacterized protein
MKFAWNPDKARKNLINHGVLFREATTVFDDALSITFPDPKHSIGEERLVIIGQSVNGRILFVSYTDCDNLTRIISAREVTRNEKRIYEESL